MKPNKLRIIRLYKCRNALFRLKSFGFTKVFSDNLADAIGTTSSQIRKDFSLFGITGNRRGGYVLEELIEKLNDVLGKDKLQSVIVVGAGNLGKALINYNGFEKEGIRIVAGFDNADIKTRKINNIPIYNIDRIKGFIDENKIKIGIIAVPDISAQQVLNLMIDSGIEGVLNFAPIRLTAPENCVVNNVNLGLELETLIYFVNVMKNGQGKLVKENLLKVL